MTDMTSAVIIGLIAFVLGILMFWQRERVSALNRGWNKRLGKPGELSSAIGTTRYFAIGAILMTLTGAAIIIYSLVART